MAKNHVILYVPGLGDDKLTAQRRALRLWRLHGVTHEICAVKWLNKEDWPTKLKLLVDRIDNHVNAGNTVSLVGISAGGSAVISAYGERADVLNAVVLVCGKTQYADGMGEKYTSKHPALYDAVVSSSKVISHLDDSEKKKILNMHPIADELVSVKETRIPGVKEYTMPIFTHFGGIGYAVTLGSFKIVQFVKSRSFS